MILFIRLLIHGIVTRLFIRMIDATVQIDDDIILLIFIALLVNVVLFFIGNTCKLLKEIVVERISLIFVII